MEQSRPDPDAEVRAARGALDARIAAMRRVLELARPGSHAEALRALRDAFPDAALSERIAALERDRA